jgi:hypothetical protein
MISKALSPLRSLRILIWALVPVLLGASHGLALGEPLGWRCQALIRCGT